MKRIIKKPGVKLIPIVLVLVLSSALTLLSACGKKADESKALQEADLKFIYNDMTFELDSDVQPLLKELGSDYEFSEAPSCVYEGTDKAYEYSGIAIYTYPLNGKDLIDEIILTDSEYETNKGIRVGSTKEDIVAAYGEEYIEEGNMHTYRLHKEQADSPCIYFVLNNGTVESISFYSASNM
ncbi:MAG: hypothetical protein PHV32_08295 [Eubacteriales bacterium]|nr:hypothetical protein [Eubacteriales bacterium]